jgi:hypothetical protein
MLQIFPTVGCFLWSTSWYIRHAHGPLAIYLAKIGQITLPTFASSPEFCLRFPLVLFGSLSIGITYWGIRHTFGGSRFGALAGAILLLFSVIRLQDTNVIGPHYPMLTVVVLVMTLGYRWRDVATIGTASVLGLIFGVAIVTMTYAIPLAIAWILSITVAGGSWIKLDRIQVKISWSLFWVFAIAIIVAAVLWPPSLFQQATISDFSYLAHYRYHPTLVGTHIFEQTPKIALLYWLTHLELPTLITSIIIVPLFVLRQFKQKSLAAKGRYLVCFTSVLLAVVVTAYIAGARNLLQLLGALCLTLGAFFDDAFENQLTLLKVGAAGVLVGCVTNLSVLSRDSDWIPYLANDGYQAFVEQNGKRLGEHVTAIVYGTPILNFYAYVHKTAIHWNVTELPWTTLADAQLPRGTQYALVSEIIYRCMPPDQPVRRIICDHWKLIWSFKSNHSWGLRLYEKPCEHNTIGRPKCPWNL